jgi:transposase
MAVGVFCGCSLSGGCIEKFFSKLKALLRKAAKRSIDALWKKIGDLLDAVTPCECSNFFASCGFVNT